MHTARLPTVRVSVAVTRWEYPGPMSRGRWVRRSIVQKGEGGILPCDLSDDALLIPPREQTDTSENITVPKLHLRVVNISDVVFPFDSKCFIFCTKGNFTKK